MSSFAVVAKRGRSKVSALHGKALQRGVYGYLSAKDWVEQRSHMQVVPSAEGDASPLEEGSTTVEYAIGAIATAGFAGLLIVVLKSGGVKTMITNIIQSALSI